ncbi:MAG: YmdB family metallophosphoesterase [Planctomycetales bacterium]|nr:YmdB family metallophosphoesterase [Planctomycetales bacterium]
MLVGDVVGKPGLQFTVRCIRGLKRRELVDIAVVNAENAADGSGLTPPMFHSLIDAGADCVTLGDHIYRRREIFEVLESDNRIVKPCNYPDDAPGKRWTVVSTPSGASVGIFSALGRVFMKPVDCPFRAADRVLEEMPSEAKIRLLDFHAEATSDMQLMGRYLDGRVSAVLGTHTHVPTADEQILPGGTAFQSDVGMTGPHDSILGRQIDKVQETTLTFRPTFFQVAKNDVKLHATVVDVNDRTGAATDIRRVVVTQDDVKELEQLIA